MIQEKKNTVILDLETYNELRDFKKAIANNKFAIQNGWGNYIYYLNENEMISKLNNKIDELEKREIKREKEIPLLLEMTFIQLFKWWRKNK